jgi:Flp pilus assembly protein TadD
MSYILDALKNAEQKFQRKSAEERMQLIQVLYRNNRRGPVDDITLDELVRSRKITHFYRPSEERWVDIFVDPVRGRGDARDTEGLKRRYTDKEADNGQSAREEKSGGFLRTVLTHLKKYPPHTAVTAEERLERGLSAIRKTDDQVGAARVFALSIRVNPQYQQAYLHRGLVYETLGNLQQAIEDYGMAIALDPKNGKARSARGLVPGRSGVTVEAMAGLRRVADLQRAHARTVLASPTELREALDAFTELRRAGNVSDAGTEAFSEVAGNLQRLTEKYEKRMPELEAQLGALRRKHAILLEAARLLEEEGLAHSKTLDANLSDANLQKK